MKQFWSQAVIWAAAPVSNGLSNQPGVDLTVQSLFGIVAGLVCWASRFALVAMVIAIIWYGIQFITARGNEGKFKEAKKSLTYAVIGIVIILGAYTIIATVGNAVQSAGSGSPTTTYTMFIPLKCASY